MNIADQLRHYGGQVAPQNVPSHQELIDAGWEDTGHVGRYSKDLIYEDMDTVGHVLLDRLTSGFVINMGSLEWVPLSLGQTNELLNELAFQLYHYGELQ